MSMALTRWFQRMMPNTFTLTQLKTLKNSSKLSKSIKQNILPVETKQLKSRKPKEIPKDERPYGQKWLERRQAYIDYHKELDQRLKDAIARL
tara:strand:- start:632 stop:907 length:276 start_codon:yes stop_codon:yes gene_type:complete